MQSESPSLDLSAAYWIVLTPSVDDAGWRKAILSAADAVGWMVIHEPDASGTSARGPVLVITEDAERPALHSAERIAAIIAEPETAPDAAGELHGIYSPESNLLASLLLARAMALAPRYRLITPAELAARPSTIELFGTLRITPPVSKAEVSRKPAVSAAFKLFRAEPKDLADPIEWSEKLFSYDPRASRDWPTCGVLDTTGRPRILVFGPFLSMPPGQWRARMRFAVDSEAAQRQYRLDWGTRTACVSEYVTPGAPGVYELEMDFTWTEVDVAEIRLILVEGSFMGTLMFQGITVEPTPVA